MAILSSPSGDFSTQSDWFQQNQPSGGAPFDPSTARDLPTTGPDGTIYSGMTGKPVSLGRGGNADALIAQWQQQHPANNPDVPGLVQFLQQNGIPAQQATHAGGQLSDDKITINGGMYDLGSSLGGPDASWFSNPQPDTNDPNAGGKALPNNNGGGFGSLAQPFGQQFTAPTDQDVMGSAAFKTRLAAGVQAIQRSAAAKGTLLTGGTLKDLTSFASDLGSSEYGQEWQRRMQALDFNRSTFYGDTDRLFGRNFQLADLGARSAGASATAGQNFGDSASQNITGAGNAQAQGTISNANNTAGAISGIGQNAYLNQLLRQGANA